MSSPDIINLEGGLEKGYSVEHLRFLTRRYVSTLNFELGVKYGEILTETGEATWMDWISYGRAWMYSQHPDCLLRAAECFQKASELAPSSETTPYMKLGHAHARMGKPEEAIEFFSMVIDIDGGDHVAYDCRASEKSRIGQFESAMEDLTVCLRLKPDYPVGFAARGLLRCYQGRRDLAEIDFKEGFGLPKAVSSNLLIMRSMRAIARLHWREYSSAILDITSIVEYRERRKDMMTVSAHLWRRAFARLHLPGEQDNARHDFERSYKICGEFRLLSQLLSRFPHLATEFDEVMPAFGDTEASRALQHKICALTADQPSERLEFVIARLRLTAKLVVSVSGPASSAVRVFRWAYRE